MKKEFMIPIIIILIVVFAMGFFVLTDSSSNSNSNSSSESTSVSPVGTVEGSIIKVGDISYDLPKGYKQGDTNGFGHISITNGSNVFYFGVFKDKTIKELTTEFMDFTKSKNYTASHSDFKENGISVTRYENDQSGSNHCWFEYNGKVYTIYTWVETPDDEEIIANLIDSIK